MPSGVWWRPIRQATSTLSPFAHSAMDGFALRAAEIAEAAEEAPATLRVIAEIGAGDVFEGTIGDGECVRIMTGACLPADADAVVKYEIVGVVEGDGKPGSVVSFCRPDEGGLQHPRRRRGGPCGRRGRGSGRCAHRRRRRLFGRLRRAGGARLPPTARGRHRHGQRAGAALRGARPRQDPQLQQLRHGRLRPARPAPRPMMLPIVQDTFEALRDAVAACGPRVRLRRHYGRRRQRRLRLHQAGGGRARRAC